MSIFKSFLFFLGILLPLNIHAKQPPPNQVRWGYEYELSPYSWGTLSPDYRLCSQGENQSPVDIKDANLTTGQNLGSVQFDYKSSDLNISNTGHTIELKYKNGSKMWFEEEEYELKNLHFHAPAEHIIQGKRSNMEAHFVHSDKQGNLVVVALMINRGKMNYALHDIFNNIPQQVGGENLLEDKKINPLDFFPKGGGYYIYMGSLTTPPCRENVKWIILHDSIEASLDQIMKFTSVYRMNARPTQPLNGRKVLRKI